jgi:hypothetical protein
MAERKRKAPRTRNFLAVIKGKIARKGASSDEIVATLRRDHPEAIRAEMDDIVQIGLIKLTNDTCSLKSGSATSLQLEMFNEYDTGRMINLRVEGADGHVRKVYKAVDALTKIEARQHVAENTKPARPRQSKEIIELARLVEDMDKYGEADWTLGRCWKASRGG